MTLAPENFDIIGQAMKGDHDVWNPYAPNFSDQQHLGAEALKPVLPELIFPTTEDLKLLPPPVESTRADWPAPVPVGHWEDAPAPHISDLAANIPAPAKHRAEPTDTRPVLVPANIPDGHGQHRATVPVSASVRAYTNMPAPNPNDIYRG